MAEAEIDDVAFLTGDHSKKQTLLIRHHQGMEPVRPLTCSKGQSLCITSVVLAVLVAIALIAAFARPFPRCTPLDMDDHDDNNDNDNGDDEDDDDHNGPSAVMASSPPLPLPTALTGQTFPVHDIRLPDFIVPVHYSLFMHPNLTKFTNVGSVNITFYVEKETEFIVLHSKELNIEELSLRDEDGDDVQIVQHLEYPPHEQLYIEFRESIGTNQNYTLEIDFSKKLEEKLEGFYISSYSTSQGEKSEDVVPTLLLEPYLDRYMATTYFEATSARSAFPCFDEPALKASFELRIVHDQHHEAYFNSEIEEEIPYKDDLLVSVFEPTVRMSTYLVAFVVCDFRAVNKMTKGGVKVQVLAPLEQLDQSHFALNTAVDILDYFHDFFDIEYPLKKLDLIAIPDFGPGAMENWGLIAFRTTAILVNENESSVTNKENVATIIAHELAHQWFGNLVTMEWWNDLWLNEGFASFAENLGTNHLKPEWKMMDQFTLVTTQDALALDSLESSHRILADVKNPTEIESIFDAISYKKGSAIIRMLESFLGLETLREGLHVYLNKFRFDNARTDDLWEAFTKFAHVNVTAVMNTWTQQKGFPLLHVTRKVETVTVKQERFLLTPPEEDDADEDDLSPFGYKWYIPVSYITDGASDAKLLWLNMTNGQFRIPRYTEWLKVNVNQTGFYRVLYDDENFKDLTVALQQNHKAFSSADRASLIDDAMVLARVGKLEVDLAFELLKYLKKERDYVPWETALIHLDTLDTLMQESSGYPEFKKYVLNLLKPIIEQVGWEDEGTHSDRKLRASVLSMAARFEDEETVKVATEMFENWKEHGIHISPNLRSVVYTAGVRHGDEDDWEFCWHKYMESNVPSDKHLLLTALGNTDDIWQLSQYLDYSLEREKIRPQDVTSVITVTARNPFGKLLTWRFVRAHWADLLEMFGDVSFSLDAIISETVSHFNTKYDYKEVESFFSSVKTGSGARAAKQSLERIQANTYWNEHLEDDFIKWLKKNNDDKDDDDKNDDDKKDDDDDDDDHKNHKNNGKVEDKNHKPKDNGNNGNGDNGNGDNGNGDNGKGDNGKGDNGKGDNGKEDNGKDNGKDDDDQDNNDHDNTNGHDGDDDDKDDDKNDDGDDKK